MLACYTDNTCGHFILSKGYIRQEGPAHKLRVFLVYNHRCVPNLNNTMNKTDIKVLKAIKATEIFLSTTKNKEEFTDYGLTIYGCEKRNLEEYKEMVGKDKRKLTGRLRELYQAI